jgi:hypothetical protein
MVEPDEASNSDIDRELRQPVKYDHRHSKSNPGAPELAMMQYGDSFAARSALGGLTATANTAGHSATMVNVTRLKTSFIRLPTTLHLVTLFSTRGSHALKRTSVTSHSFLRRECPEHGCRLIGMWRNRIPVAAKMALSMAGATTVVPGAPRRTGAWALSMNSMSRSGTSPMRSGV